MTTFRKAGLINFIVGAILIALGVVGTVGFAGVTFDPNLFWGTVFAMIFVLVGGYEVGKYAEMRHEQRKIGDSLTGFQP